MKMTAAEDRLIRILHIAEEAMKEVREYMDAGNYGVAACIGTVALDHIKVLAEGE
jgi:hypothetical protein